MKNRTFQRLLPTLRTLSLILTVTVCYLADFAVCSYLPEEAVYQSDALMYVGMLLTALLVVPLANVGQVIVARCFGWPVERYEALLHTLRRDEDGHWITERGCTQTRFLGMALLKLPEWEPEKNGQLALLVLGDTLFALAWMVLFGLLTIWQRGAMISLVFCELSMGGFILLMRQLLPLGRRYTLSSIEWAALVLKNPEQGRIFWGSQMLYAVNPDDTARIDEIMTNYQPCVEHITTTLDALCVLNHAIIALQAQDYAQAQKLTKRVMEANVRLSEQNWQTLLHVGVICELLCEVPGCCVEAYQGREGKSARHAMYSSPLAATAYYAMQRLNHGSEEEARILRKRISLALDQDPATSALFCKIDAMATRQQKEEERP